MTKLTHQQKLDALSYRFYQDGQWTPKAGDFYTTSRADLELYQVVSVEGGLVRTRYTEGSDTISEWPEIEFLTGGFGPKRVFVPEWVICAPAPQAKRVTVSYANCCSGSVRYCDCTNPDHGTALMGENEAGDDYPIVDSSPQTNLASTTGDDTAEIPQGVREREIPGTSANPADASGRKQQRTALTGAPTHAPAAHVRAWTQEDAERENAAFTAWFKERGYPNYPHYYPLTTENAMHAAWQEAAKRTALAAPEGER